MSEIIPPCHQRCRYIKAGGKKEKKSSKEVLDISSSVEESSSKIEETLKYVYGEKK